VGRAECGLTRPTKSWPANRYFPVDREEVPEEFREEDREHAVLACVSADPLPPTSKSMALLLSTFSALLLELNVT
jgi:hypothetical protein